MEPRLRGADGDAEGPRDLVQGALFEVVEGKDCCADRRSTSRSKAASTAARSSASGAGSAAPEDHSFEVDLLDAPAPAQQITAAICEDGVEPGVEPALVAKRARKVLPGRDESILGGIPGVCFVPDDRAGQPSAGPAAGPPSAGRMRRRPPPAARVIRVPSSATDAASGMPWVRSKAHIVGSS